VQARHHCCVSSRKPGDPKDPAAVEATLDDLAPVDSDPSLVPVTTSTTLDEEPGPEPSATQILDPVVDAPKKAAPRPTGVHTLDVSADAPSTQARRRAALKSDAFESFPSLGQARSEEVAPRGPPPAWKKTSAWTPGVVAMAVMLVALLLVGLVILLRS
jgi:hypothetical protein